MYVKVQEREKLSKKEREKRFLNIKKKCYKTTNYLLSK